MTHINRKKLPETEEESATLVKFQDVSASWQPLSEQSGELFTGEEIESDEENSTVFRKVNFRLSRREKVAVIGMVGSGKTSLLMGILGEMPIEQGTVYTREETEEFVLAEQEPLIVTGTVESNILFGLKKEVEWYE